MYSVIHCTLVGEQAPMVRFKKSRACFVSTTIFRQTTLDINCRLGTIHGILLRSLNTVCALSFKSFGSQRPSLGLHLPWNLGALIPILKGIPKVFPCPNDSGSLVRLSFDHKWSNAAPGGCRQVLLLPAHHSCIFTHPPRPLAIDSVP